MNKTYPELIEMIKSGPLNYEITGPDGEKYNLVILALWDSRPGGNIRVMSNIDDGGWRALFPFTNDFIKGPSGYFVGE
jgi:hypothetical protein